MLHSLQETKYDFFLLLLFLLLLQPTQMKFKQQQQQQNSGIKVAPKKDRLHAYMPHI